MIRRILLLSKLLFGLVAVAVVLHLASFECASLGMRGAALLVGLVLVVEVERAVRRAVGRGSSRREAPRQ
ncbi:hypothetical protein [Myxococcus virescens]|uniref:Uncharacterized protein n=1 Tax=Myxococcus virescens TaxID=83456 RepID=A0A511HPU2_9BACT|nr:hypothetical protein [Myxococcus virescens]GEL75385.1 hypothetical protein MVI01_71690 [Myxococcus virescens]SDE65672.1 hypothetical protein SAMN04488504_109299 [Myxococcus virescens]